MSKKDRALNAFQKHRKLLDQPEYLNQHWFAGLADLIDRYIGNDTELYKSAQYQAQYARSDRPNDVIKNGQQILDTATSIIKHSGVRRKYGIWLFLNKQNQHVIWLMFAALLYFVFWIGRHI